MYQRQNELKLDDNVSAYYAMKSVDRWLSIRLEILGNTIVFISACLAVFSASRAGSAGISLNNALSVTTLMNWAVRNGAETESIMNSVERVLYTTLQTPQVYYRPYCMISLLWPFLTFVALYLLSLVIVPTTSSLSPSLTTHLLHCSSPIPPLFLFIVFVFSGTSSCRW